jgi:putative transposase
VEKATWLSPIVVIPNKNGKFKICVNNRKLKVATKKDPFLLPFIDEVLNTVVGCEACSFLDGYFRYYHISIILEDKYKITFVIDWRTFI